jgi:hypothetical protein
MKFEFDLKNINIKAGLSVLIPILIYWIILILKIPYSFSHYISLFSFSLFLLVLVLYYLSFRAPVRFRVFAGLALTMLLFGLALSYKWTSGYSDNGVIAGLLPYKDAKNYYFGANLILNSLPLIEAVNSTWRPLFPGFLSTLLLFTGQNLKTALAILVGLTGLGCYLTVEQIRRSFGVLSASVYGTLLFFYAQPFIGFTVSEMAGLLFGCFGFLLLWRAADTLKIFDLVLGLVVLMAAVSARAGAFIIFPFLAIWAGWVFRKTERFSFKAAGIAILTVLAGYYLLNSVYPRLFGIPPGSSFGNFAFEIYGQIHGGTGWHSAINDLGTTNSTVVYRAAIRFFTKHPCTFLVGAAKAYRDFFLPDLNSIFAYSFTHQGDWPNLLLWIPTIFLLVWGLFRMFKKIQLNHSSLIAAGFIGIFLSIPFLPPVDGGGRFYASTMPFFFILPAVALAQFHEWSRQDERPDEHGQGVVLSAYSGSILLLGLMLIVPVFAYNLHMRAQAANPVCINKQFSFTIRAHPDSYIDVIAPAASSCGLIPNICLSEFKKNGTEYNTDDFFQELVSLTTGSQTVTRIIPTVNLRDATFHYFVVADPGLLLVPDGQVVSGCATEIRTKNQSIYQIESILPPGN